MAEDAQMPTEATLREHTIGLSLRAAKELRSRLGIHEALYRNDRYDAHPRAFFLYESLDEVEKAAMSLMQIGEFVLDDPNAGTDDGSSTARTAGEMVLEDLHLRGRRLLELFVSLVMFETTNEGAFYSHYLRVHELDDVARDISDRRDYQGIESPVADAWANHLLTQVQAEEATLDAARVWYATIPTTKRRPQLSNVSEMFRHAFGAMRLYEKMAFGTTYGEAYSRPSRTVHYGRAHRGAAGPQLDGMRGTATQLQLQVMCVIARVLALLGDPTVPAASAVRDLLERTDGSRYAELLITNSPIGVGDFVVIHGFLAEVIDEKISAHGHRALKIEFFDGEPCPGVSQDWVAARYAKRLVGRDADEKVRALVGDRGTGVPAEEIRAVLREGARSLWRELLAAQRR